MLASRPTIRIYPKRKNNLTILSVSIFRVLPFESIHNLSLSLISSMSARASGADAGDSKGSARHREHHDGSSSRSYTPEQKETVIRVRKCSPTAFYDILGLESVRSSCTESEIKKAYRKLSLLTHPDKNGYDGADEAFKMVSRSFQVLSDSDKRSRYDKFGGDPDSRASAASASSPFSGFARQSQAGGPTMFTDEEISAEELFRQFFGGGMGGMGGFGGGFPFDTGPQFVFNMGGPRGIRVTQFGGGIPRRRPRNAENGPQEAQADLWHMVMQFLPLVLFFLLPLLSSLLSAPAGPTYSFNRVSPYTKQITTAKLRIPYWIKPSDYTELSRGQLRNLDSRVEQQTINELNAKCAEEQNHRERIYLDAQGWFSVDEDMMNKARTMKLASCDRLSELKNMAS